MSTIAGIARTFEPRSAPNPISPTPRIALVALMPISGDAAAKPTNEPPAATEKPHCRWIFLRGMREMLRSPMRSPNRREQHGSPYRDHGASGKRGQYRAVVCTSPPASDVATFIMTNVATPLARQLRLLICHRLDENRCFPSLFRRYRPLEERAHHGGRQIARRAEVRVDAGAPIQRRSPPGAAGTMRSSSQALVAVPRFYCCHRGHTKERNH